MNITKAFQEFGLATLNSLDADLPVAEIEKELRLRKIAADGVERAKFKDLFYACSKALISQRWSLCCKNQGIDSKETQDLLFKLILERYSGPRDLEAATAFSEALYAANADPEQAPMIAIATFFFKKVSVQDLTVESGVPDAFAWLVGVWDGYCMHFENTFDDFIAELRVNELKLNRKRG